MADTDANLQQLRAIFPDADPDVCLAVLTANDNNLEAAINNLLTVSGGGDTGGNVTSPAAPISEPSATGLTDEQFAQRLAQQEQDEEFARRLQEEDQGTRRLSRPPRSPQPAAPGQQVSEWESNISGQGMRYGAASGADSLRETKEKVIAASSAFGETAKKKLKELYDKISSKEGGSSGPTNGGGSGGGSKQQYNSLPEDDFDSFMGPPMRDDTPSDRPQQHQSNYSYGNSNTPSQYPTTASPQPYSLSSGGARPASPNLQQQPPLNPFLQQSYPDTQQQQQQQSAPAYRPPQQNDSLI
ncbi:hypothetical protein DFS34DRAFT_589055 [Phlyctochytrium arcticum]|nr:hypothetical protein DFS34DRAFT_589055 [Phlyctochytrium arcticum]